MGSVGGVTSLLPRSFKISLLRFFQRAKLSPLFILTIYEVLWRALSASLLAKFLVFVPFELGDLRELI